MTDSFSTWQINKRMVVKMDDITYKDALIIGSFQAAAIFPAISRSGMTIVAALWRKLDRETAAYFFLLRHQPLLELSFCNL